MPDTTGTRYCPRPHKNGGIGWRHGSPPLDRLLPGPGWACPGIAPDGSACGYEEGTQLASVAPLITDHDAMLERLRSLVAQWRKSAESLASSNPGWSSHFYDCALDLERLIEGKP